MVVFKERFKVQNEECAELQLQKFRLVWFVAWMGRLSVHDGIVCDSDPVY